METPLFRWGGGVCYPTFDPERAPSDEREPGTAFCVVSGISLKNVRMATMTAFFFSSQS